MKQEDIGEEDNKRGRRGEGMVKGKERQTM